MKLSERAQRIEPSLTLEISAIAGELKKKGVDVINLSAGEPDFQTPEYICKAAKSAIDEGFTGYTNVRGIIELREAISKSIKYSYSLDYPPEQIIVCNGAKQALYNFFQVDLDSGDEVLLPTPYWLTYPSAIELAEGTVKYVNTKFENDFKITPGLIEKHITEKTRGIIINSPSNPTGAVYTKKELAEIGEVLVRNSLFALSDDIYEHLIFDGLKFNNIISACPDLISESIIMNGLSKSHCMTGWRVGYAAGPKNIIDKMAALQGHSTSNICSIAQKAALAAYRENALFPAKMMTKFQERRDYLFSSIGEIPGFRPFKPSGAFYLFVCIDEAMKNYSKLSGKTVGTSIAFSKILLEEAHVAVVPGVVFGADDYIRISFANSMENLEKAISNLRELMNV